jgi:hypothetical protein
LYIAGSPRSAARARIRARWGFEDQDVTAHEDRAHARPAHGGERAGEVLGAAHREVPHVELEAARGGRDLPSGDVIARRLGVPQHADAGQRRQRILEQLELLAGQFLGIEGETGRVAARPGQTRDESLSERHVHAP